MSKLDEQVRRTLQAEAGRFRPAPDAWARLSERLEHRSRYQLGWLPAAAVAVLAVPVLTVVAIAAARSGPSTTDPAGGPGATGSPGAGSCLAAGGTELAVQHPGYGAFGVTVGVASPAGGNPLLCLSAGRQSWSTISRAGQPVSGLTEVTFQRPAGASGTQTWLVGELRADVATAQVELAAPVTLSGGPVTMQPAARVRLPATDIHLIAGRRVFAMPVQVTGHCGLAVFSAAGTQLAEVGCASVSLPY